MSAGAGLQGKEAGCFAEKVREDGGGGGSASQEAAFQRKGGGRRPREAPDEYMAETFLPQVVSKSWEALRCCV